MDDDGSTVTVEERSDGGGKVKDELLDDLVKFMEMSEFDPKHAIGWIRTKASRRTPIIQENFAKGIDHFSNSSYVMVADTQIGKTLSFLFLMFKAGLTEGMPSVLLTKNNTGEVDRFQKSVDNFNKIARASWKAVKKAHKKKHGQATGMKVRGLRVYASVCVLQMFEPP